MINGTELKIPLPTPLASGSSVECSRSTGPITCRRQGRNGRGVREQVKDGWLYEMAQWFPRAAVYDDVNGWQTDQFLGQGEFYLNFGNYDVSLTVPHDHIVQGDRRPGEPGRGAHGHAAVPPGRRVPVGQAPMFIVRADEVMTPGTSSLRHGAADLALQGGERPGLRLGVLEDLRVGRRRLQVPADAEADRDCIRCIPATRCRSGTRFRPGRSSRP